MPQYTLAEAAAATGRSKSTVLRSIRAGRISAVRDGLTGGWLIEPAELHRLYPAPDDAVRGTGNDTPRNGDDAELRVRLADKDSLIAAHERALNDLRHLLEEERAERRQAIDRLVTAHAQIAALLTHQRQPGRRWWPWGRRA